MYKKRGKNNRGSRLRLPAPAEHFPNEACDVVSFLYGKWKIKFVSKSVFRLHENDNLYVRTYANIVHMFYFTMLIIYFRLVVIIVILINFIKYQFKYSNNI